MTAKDLERLIVRLGGNASALDTVTRKLREATRLSTAGRGFNAPALSAAEAAWILMAYAGSPVAARAGRTVLTFSDFRRPETVRIKEPRLFLSNDFNAALQELLQIHELLEHIESVSLAHNIPMATISLKDGRRANYCHAGANVGDVEARAAECFISQGVLTQGLLKQIADGLATAEETSMS